MIVKTVNGKTPRWGKNCFIADNAALSGDCLLGDDCSVWYSAVLRSDVDAIRCGNRVNIQDCACIHQTGGMPCILEDDVSVGHGAVVHGATVRKGALIGMNATVCSTKPTLAREQSLLLERWCYKAHTCLPTKYGEAYLQKK